MIIVYKWTNRLNGKAYVGFTSKPKERRNAHMFGTDRSSWLYQAIKKHGIENFAHEVLEVVGTRGEANKREKHYIQLFDTYHNGYNRTKGGDGGTGLPGEKGSGAKLTEEQAKAIITDPRPHAEVARDYGLKSGSTVMMLRQGKTWKHLDRSQAPDYDNGLYKITKEQAEQIIMDDCMPSETAKKFGITTSAVCRIKKGLAWPELDRSKAPMYQRVKYSEEIKEAICSDDCTESEAVRKYGVSRTHVRRIRGKE